MAMKYEEILTLIPGHCMEDLPSELGEDEAASLLNSFCVPWHPKLLTSTDAAPRWHQSDEPPFEYDRRLIFVPRNVEDWLPHDWVKEARERGATVVAGLTDRNEMIAQALAGLVDTEQDAAAADGEPQNDEIDPDLTADFLALGTCRLMTELLTCHMHHYSGMEEDNFEREAIKGAQAAIDGNVDEAKVHLSTAFEHLTEARERFYPVRCYLIDVCLMMEELFDDHFDRLLKSDTPVNLLMKANDLNSAAETHSEQIERIRTRLEAGTLNLVGGERFESPAPMIPLQSMLFDFQQGLAIYQKLFEETPRTWGRRRFGFSSQVPQILKHNGYHSALHIALDDGLYPDKEHSRTGWEGCDGSTIDALSRIPLPADSAASFLRFPVRMAEAMEQDMIASIMFARWPELRTPWMEDFQRAHSYSPVLGEFVTIDEFIESTDDHGDHTKWHAYEYLSPFFLQAVARQEADPIGRFTQHFQRRLKFDNAAMLRRTNRVLLSQPPTNSDDEHDESVIEAAGPDAETADVEAAKTLLTDLASTSLSELAKTVLHGAGDQKGTLLINPQSFARVVPVESQTVSPERRSVANVSVPANGYRWISDKDLTAAQDKTGGPPLYEEGILRNGSFEVHINEQTGGIAKVKGHGRRPARISQQLAFRLPQQVTIPSEDGDEQKTWYSTMRCDKLEVVAATTGFATVKSTGQLVDPISQDSIVGFTQTITVRLGRPTIDIHIELDEPTRMPDGDPWSNYIACRFAWNDAAASVTRSVYGQAQAIKGERFETSDYIEIATTDEQTTIVPHGLPFHRKTSMRTLDSIMVVGGETNRSFDFTIAIDQKLPMQCSLDAMSAVSVINDCNGPPRTGDQGWFFHVDSKTVQLISIHELQPVPPDDADPPAETDPQPISDQGFALRLVETEGRKGSVKVRCFKQPTSARQRDFKGNTISQLTIEPDGVIVELTRFEIADIELRF